MPSQLSFIAPRQPVKPAPRLLQRDTSPRDSGPQQGRPSQVLASPLMLEDHRKSSVGDDEPGRVRSQEEDHLDPETGPAENIRTNRDHEVSPSTRPAVARPDPHRRHSPSPPPAEALDDAKYKPHTVTAQGFPVNNKVKKAKYATSIDNRGYLAVYEFQLNDQTIMWDYSSGIVHLTGIWKALGNSKADIVRLVDNHPELEGVIRRIRGGFLKIQGTWVPFELCRRLAIRTCYPIRHALISVFGPDFPEECLKPGTKGYGTLTLDDSAIDRQRKKRRTVPGSKAEVFGPSTPSPPKVGVRERRPRLAHTTRPRRSSTFSTSSTSSTSSPSERKDKTEKKTSPPPIPRVVNLQTDGFRPSNEDLLDLLRASRSLQKISAGDDGEWSQQGGRFNLNGTSATFLWDGSDSLDVIGLDPLEGSPQISVESWDMPPGMTRNFSTHSGDCAGPLTPPPVYQDLNAVSIRQVPAILDSPISGALPPLPPLFRKPQEWRGKGVMGSAFDVIHPNPLGPQMKPLGIDVARSW